MHKEKEIHYVSSKSRVKLNLTRNTFRRVRRVPNTTIKIHYYKTTNNDNYSTLLHTN